MASFTFDPLTPAGFLRRSAAAFPGRVAVVDGSRWWTYREFAGRCDALRGALAGLGVGPGDRVAALCVNSHVMLEMHHAVPAHGAVLVPVNVRLAPDEMAYVIEHSGARVLVATAEFAGPARELAGRTGVRLVEPDEYESLLAAAHRVDPPEIDERQLLAINYTSGTTGRPKGVMYHHRGAFLQAVAMCYHARLGPDARYLWTLPMFHCDGWSFTWAVTAAGGTHVCLRRVDVDEIWQRLTAGGITHLSAAPTVLTMIAEAGAAVPLPEGRTVHVDTGGAQPSPTLLARLDRLGLRVTHLYGLTETFGPIAINEWQGDWDAEPDEVRARLRARQGIGNIIASPLRVVDPDGRDVLADGETIGEIAVRGNDVMLGYYRDEAATEAVTVDGRWLLTGDLAVMHPDGYVEIRDRRKDIIISGGENIASVEVEQALDSHPDVVESAVVGRPDPRWGEVPVAYVHLRAGVAGDPADLAAHLRARLAGFKVPRSFVFTELPKTSTGKVQKNVLRARSDQGQ
ncbi:AMP-binding protein [Phytohabitans kaempferiae]|uniref:AMP-binding protein n=1 Tax=Phytohabitans kaempferiae TaxID=1620943 RepID=A0ABV6M746_9ACTN